MALDRGNYYDESFKVWMMSPNGKEQLVWRMMCENCLAGHNHPETKRSTIECTIPLLNCLLQMMNLSSSVKKHIDQEKCSRLLSVRILIRMITYRT